MADDEDLKLLAKTGTLAVSTAVPGSGKAISTVLALREFFPAVDRFLTGHHRETLEARSDRLFGEFLEQVSVAGEFTEGVDREEAVLLLLEQASGEDIDRLLREVRRAMDAVTPQSYPYLAVLMADVVTRGQFAGRFFRDACSLFCDLDPSELREVWCVMMAVDEVSRVIAEQERAPRPGAYKLVPQHDGSMVVAPTEMQYRGGQPRARAQGVTELGWDALLRHHITREYSGMGEGYTGRVDQYGSAFYMESLARIFILGGPPSKN